jgi:hypothetical protein
MIKDMILEIIKGFREISFGKPKSLHDRHYLTENDLSGIGTFEELEVYVDEDHIKRSLLKHIPSGELYFYEWYEEIDWVDGNDPQYEMYIPVESKEIAERMSNPEMTHFGGSACTPRIINHWHADDTREIRWVRE